MICTQLQHNIEQRYDLKLTCQIQDHLCHDKELLESIIEREVTSVEELLISEFSDSLDVTLFLSEHLLDAFTEKARYNMISDKFDDYCTVLEGVSHFVYLVWNAQYNRQVKPVEMELQAEVDKFVFSATERHLVDQQITSSQSTGMEKQSMRQLATRLFNNIKFLPQTEQEVSQRYRRANSFAAEYCQWLYNHHSFTRKDAALNAELARFYRMSGTRKFEHIQRLTDPTV